MTIRLDLRFLACLELPLESEIDNKIINIGMTMFRIEI